MKIDIPGREPLDIAYLLLDANGTITLDGELIAGVVERLKKIKGLLEPIVITADTLGTAREKLSHLPAELFILGEGAGSEGKKGLINRLGARRCAAIGNGMNDRLMLKEAALGIAVIGPEGGAAKAVAAADIIVGDINSALDLILEPARIRAVLRD